MDVKVRTTVPEVVTVTMGTGVDVAISLVVLETGGGGDGVVVEMEGGGVVADVVGSMVLLEDDEDVVSLYEVVDVRILVSLVIPFVVEVVPEGSVVGLAVVDVTGSYMVGNTSILQSMISFRDNDIFTVVDDTGGFVEELGGGASVALELGPEVAAGLPSVTDPL